MLNPHKASLGGLKILIRKTKSLPMQHDTNPRPSFISFDSIFHSDVSTLRKGLEETERLTKQLKTDALSLTDQLATVQTDVKAAVQSCTDPLCTTVKTLTDDLEVTINFNKVRMIFFLNVQSFFQSSCTAHLFINNFRSLSCQCEFPGSISVCEIDFSSHFEE
jgi:hypothetical protein